MRVNTWLVAAGEAAKRVVRELEIFAEERIPRALPIPEGTTFAEMLGEEPTASDPHPEE